MTNAMPVIINSLFPFMTRSLDAEARTSIEKARETFAAAEEETKFGDIAGSQISSDAGDANKNMVAIAVWHYGRGIKKYLEAFGKFEKALRLNLPPKYRKYVEKKMKECLDRSNFANLQKRSAEGKK
jgi:hypothetical protein